MAALPAEVPMATVAEPVDVTAVVGFITPPMIIALLGMVGEPAGMMAPTAPPSTAKSYLACAVTCIGWPPIFLHTGELLFPSAM